MKIQIVIYEFQYYLIEQKDLQMKKSSIFKDYKKSRQSLHIIRSQTIIKKQNKSKKSEFNIDSLVKQFIQQRQGSLNFGFLTIFAILCGRRKIEKEQITYAYDKIKQKLDVHHILNKLFEIEKLKSILLDEDQLKLFNYMPKPCIPISIFDSNKKSIDIGSKLKVLEQKSQFLPILAEEKTELKKALEAMEAFKVMYAKSKRSKIDEKVLQFLDEDMRDLFSIFVEEEKGHNKEFDFKSNCQSSQFIKGDRESYQDIADKEIQEKNIHFSEVPESLARIIK